MKKAKIKGLKIDYEERGSGPAVVWINSSDSAEAQWEAESELLAKAGFRVIRPILRSHVAGATALAGCVADNVIGLLNYLGVGRAAFVGVSLGGTLLHELVERFPRRVSVTVDLARLFRAEHGHPAEIHARLVDFLKRAKLGQICPACQPQMG